MGSKPSINIRNKGFNLFSYSATKNNTVQTDVKLKQGQQWSSLKGENSVMNSVFELVDKKYGNGDGLIQAGEVNLLNKIIQYIDNIKKGVSGNGKLEYEELEEFDKEILSKGKLDEIMNREDDNVQKSSSWSEGLDRHITSIKLSNIDSGASYISEVYEKLIEIGKKEGFSVEQVNSGGNPWIEDSSIRRSDGKVYNQLYEAGQLSKSIKYKSALNLNTVVNGSINEKGYNFDVDVPIKDVKFGDTYLEGGNVLNTLKKDGLAGAIVGNTSIAATLDVMRLEPTEENIKFVKLEIAKDLGLKEEDVIFIPQYDFHIDMLYRPLHSGEIAVPDFEEGIKILEETDTPSIKHEEKEERIAKLKELAQITKSDREEAEKRLQEAGYKLVRIPNFTVDKKDKTNFMNGVGGTSVKTGKSFYITNESEYPELQSIVSKYFNNAGVDNVYFVPTQRALFAEGGIDCLTQEF